MDERRFDDLTRFMAETPTRRTVIKAMVGAIAGSLASVGTALGAPRCKRVNQACQTTADCCPGPDANGNVYCAPYGKKSKVCLACPAETPTACDGGCIDTSSDNNNCGACGVMCPSGSSCVAGSCMCPTATPSICDGHCVNKSTDALNCGACGTVCFGGSTCVNGACRCPAGQHFDANGTCVCLGTTCTANATCCFGFVCGDNGTCIPCAANGTAVNSAAKCCSSAAVDNICVERCSSTDDCAAGTGQVCEPDGPSRVCGCPDGQHMVAGGSCVCQDTTCSDRDDCCDGYVCNASDTCVTCKPTGTTLTRPEISPDPCCGQVACDSAEPNELCVCVGACSSASDCQPGSGQLCGANGYCHCGLGKRLTFDGHCVCDDATCGEDSHCCDGYTCENHLCKAA